MTTFNINITADAIIDSSVSNKEIGQAIKAERLRKKLTALKLTQSIGIGVTALKKYEEGDGKVSTYALMQIVCALGYNGVSIQCLDN